jgi:hypothetical protein
LDQSAFFMFDKRGPADILLEIVGQVGQFLGGVMGEGAPASGLDRIANEAPYCVVESVSTGENGKIGAASMGFLRFHGVFPSIRVLAD